MTANGISYVLLQWHLFIKCRIVTTKDTSDSNISIRHTCLVEDILQPNNRAKFSASLSMFVTLVMIILIQFW